MIKGKLSNLQAHLALFTANLIYGINYTVAKDVMPDYIRPSGFVLIRVLGALLLFALFSKAAGDEKIDKADLPRLFLCGIFGVAVNQIMFFEGLNLTTPINAGIIMVITPIMVLIMSSIILREKVTNNKIAGIALGIGGALLLLLGKKSVSFTSGTLLGDLFILINAASYAVYLTIVKPLMYKYKTLTVMKWVFLFGLPFVIPFGFNEAVAINWSAITTIVWLEIIFVIFFTTFFAYMLNTMALKRVSPSVVSIYIYLQPVLATTAALITGKDELTLIKIASTLLIFAGVYLVSRPQKLYA